ncbi:NAD(P)-dependent dehydrogenase, short-chain alcohol dehydrogenase family [Sphingomonas laterariae]|uniref:NAD(P)-dependent dehydrogenase, short-chain alcohol dehydrogenase family n=1 Tax=Edaphosphingomonas laterariae TaxID=861865 RepID=A0A239E5D6_9SPHN|nr:glucose 1-dehydrogenase [Sphingomonas laterariae]SNS39223.1 NAD(P)-dependent dehydrogenase, short-chain alcohol dehydrogenase family [Sphingomonas laterariae]
MSKLFEGRTVFITGAGGGIGRAAALAFAEEGAKVAATDYNGDWAAETARMITDAGGEAYGAALDVTDRAAVDAAVEAVVTRWGRLDAAFNNAGVAIENMTTPWGDGDIYARTMAVNADGVMFCIAAEARIMAKAGGGAIVNTASIAGMSGAGGPAYCGSKHAVIGFTQSAALRWATQGVRVNAVCPGAIATPMTDTLNADLQAAAFIKQMHPMGRIGEAREVADAVVFLCSDKASFITGHPLAVDGGFLAR